ncbi:telomere repeat-binding factor 4-like [Prunus avium]|uniref:MYB transcription factor n=1 Tax=Prunus avium TaxID=42229 RepID=A0A6P5SUB6_PRUAV|nr:telomere repeat-binding factor 4-like [Prunus avium]XP_021817253.1 telomere repeat-binding factor 4-like [Prunus avium]XP_021817254.1 telomere repeat-binding factor 4-like [Prunus avium]
MGNQKQKWTAEEEEGLLAGVAKHGPGKWKNILKDPEFARVLIHRSNIDLKDKWRNLSVSTSGHGSKDRPRGTKVKNCAAAHHLVQNSAPTASVRPNASPASAPPNSSPASARPNASPASVCPNASPDAMMDDAVNSAPELKSASQYDPMIFQALSTMKDMNGSDLGAILNFIEQRHEVPVPPNFRRLLGPRLRRLVSQGKLEKVQNGYKLKKDATFGTKTPTPTRNHRDIRPRKLQNSGSMTFTETVQDAAETAAYKLADAEEKSFVAAVAMKEADRISKMTEDNESVLQLIEEIYERCSRGEVVTLA